MKPDETLGNREMFNAICSECKEACQLPFKPSGDRPVFCRDCYRKRKEGERNGN